MRRRPTNDNDRVVFEGGGLTTRTLAWVCLAGLALWAVLIALVRWLLLWLVEATR